MQHYQLSYKALSGKLQTINGNYPHINAGGCGFFAQVLGNALKNKGIKVEYIFLGSTFWSTKENIINLSNETINTVGMKEIYDEYNVALGHIVVKVDGVFIDSTGVKDDVAEFKLNYVEAGTITAETLEKWVKCSDWNNDFTDNHLYDMETIKKEVEILV